MNRQRRQEVKKKRRERENKAVRRRRVERDRCKALVLQADALWYGTRDLDQARWLLEKAVRIHPTSQEAHERLAELHIRGDRFVEGLAHYEQLTRPPGWPQVTYMAAVAAYRLARFEHARTLAQLFLRASSHTPELKAARTHARQLADACKTLARRASTSSRRGAVASDAERVPAPAIRTEHPQALLNFDAPPAVNHRSSASSASAPTAHQAVARPPHDRPGGQPNLPQHAVVHDDSLPAFPALRLQDVVLQFDVDGRSLVSDAATRLGSAADVLLRRDYAELRLQKGFDELLSIASVHGLEHFWYQLETVRRVLRDFRGRVLLADEVGLGKTIEACLALKEYWMRGLVSKALILTPPSLVGQWVDELTSKFDLAAATAEPGKVGPDDDLWDRHAIVVASLPLVRQRAYRARMSAIEYDLVIVDEAHVLKNRDSAAWRLVNELKKRFLLLLSATPLGNDLSELYNLILLLKPGLLKTEAQFRRDFGGLGALREPSRRDRLRTLLREVMVRNTRSHIDVRLPRRLAATEVVPPTEAESELQQQLSSYVRARYPDGARTDRWRVMMLQMQAGSSPAAVGAALERYHAGELDSDLDRLRARAARVGEPAKTKALIDLLRRSDEKKIVFTRFRATLDHLQTALEAAGFRVATFHGGMNAADKDRAIQRFADHATILVSTEVGGEGRNLQFCRTVINYDLPWNPMQLEQRVGRVHRIGQTREVFVFNFCLTGSLEEYILKVLHEKLNLFELVTGEIEMILGEFDAEREFADVVMELWARSATPTERDNAFDRLASGLIAARDRYLRTQETDRALFREDFEV
ncbi:MAG: DEAD/DEAH box helicase family protein [Acidobacteria bacterium]|nr:DEAD/DEAH box helicase family protein [Acidobacteriota bacterium]